MKPTRLLAAWMALAWLLALPLSHAQQVPADLPRDIQQAPGLIIDWNRKNPATHTEQAPETAAPLEPELDFETPVVEAPDSSLTMRFRVEDIKVEGVKSIDLEDVGAVVSGYEGRELSFLDLRELTDKLTGLYQEEGYMTSMVYIPPQRIQEGVVTLRAAEGKVGALIYEPDSAFWPKRTVLPRISLEPGDVFNALTLRRQLRRINENPDFKVRATLEAGQGENETNIILEERAGRPVHVTLFWDNLGRPIIGRQRAGITTTHNNVLGFGDQAYNSLSWTKESFGTVTHYEMPVGPYGTKLAFDHAYSTLELGWPHKDLDIDGEAVIYTGTVRQELVNEEATRISADLAFDVKNVKTFLSDGLLFRDRIRVLRPGLNFEHYDRNGRTLMRHEIGIGLDVMHATLGTHEKVSRQGAGSQFFRYTGSGTRIQRMPFNSFSILRVMGQVSPQKLPSVEQFQLGGAFTVRGYLEGSIIGDSGWLTSAEWRVPFYLFPANWKIPKTEYYLRDNVQVVGFADYGQVFTNNPVPGGHSFQHMLGTGIGVRASLTRFLTGRLDFGIPLLRDNLPGPVYPRLHFGLESKLF